MKNIEIDDELYQYIASKTEYIGESASAILRRLLSIDNSVTNEVTTVTDVDNGDDNEDVISSDNIVDEQVVADSNIGENVLESNLSASVFDFINKEELATQRGVVGRFLLILGALYRVHTKQFSVVLDIRGRDRLYFAQSENAILECGSSTKPRQIPDSPYWVITNSNTTRKKMMITEVATSLGYKAADVEMVRDLL